MAIELITGRAGKAHVDSSDVRAFNAYVNAGGRYVLHGGGAEMESANDLRIHPAEILMDGAHVRITGAGEEVTLENGASSYDRIDIVALHYTSVGSDDSRVESVALEVIKGTPVDTGGEAQDPAMPVPGASILDGSSEVYVPYIRVKITGLVPGDPEEILPGREQMLRDMIAGLMLSDVPGTLPISKGGTGATSAATAMSNLGVGKLLWSGSWSSGKVTIPGINQYKMLAVSVSNTDGRMVGVNVGSGAISLFVNESWGNDAATTMAVSAIRLTRSGSSETLTYDSGGRVNLGNDYSYGHGAIKAVWGVA